MIKNTPKKQENYYQKNKTPQRNSSENKQVNKHKCPGSSILRARKGEEQFTAAENVNNKISGNKAFCQTIDLH